MAKAYFQPMVRSWSKPASTPVGRREDKFIVRDDTTADTVWWGKTNVAMSPEHFAALKADFFAALATKDKLYVADLFGGSQPEHRVNVRVINELAWHNLFIRTLLVRPARHEVDASCPNTHHRSAQLQGGPGPSWQRAATPSSQSTSPKS